MSIADPLRYPFYELGVLIQQCSNCDWAQRGHVLELVVCPECGQFLGTPCALEFGGLRVVYTGKSFRLGDRRGEPVDRICEADVPSVIQFLCKHVPDFRQGRMPKNVCAERISPMLDRSAR